MHPDHDQVEEGFDGSGHVLSGGSARFKIGNPEPGRLLAGLLERDNPLVLEVGLVAAKNNVWVLAIGVEPELVEPGLDTHEGLLACDVEHDDEAHGVAEEGSCQAPEPVGSLWRRGGWSVDGRS